MGGIGYSLTALFLFGIFTPSHQTTIYVDNLHFLGASRILDIDNPQWFNTETHLLLSNGFINKVIDNHIAIKQVTPLNAVLLGTTPSATLLCSPTTGRVHQIATNQHLRSSEVLQTSDLYGLSTVCGKGGIIFSSWINNSFYTVSNAWEAGKIYKFNRSAGTLISTNDVSNGKPIKSVKSVFSSGGFVYSVYTNSKDKVEISRFCENDMGVEGAVFSTHRYGGMSCTSHGVKHDILLDAKFDPATSELCLLLTHAPVSLSSRVLCCFHLQHIDTVMDTGNIQSYDEAGRKRRTPATAISCVRDSNPGYLNNHIVDVIHSSQVVLGGVEPYLLFSWRRVGGDRVLYIATDRKLDIMAPSSSSSLTLLQTISTEFLPTQIAHTAHEVVLVRETGFLTVEPFLCHQLKTPPSCYTGRYCSFRSQVWSCVFSPTPGSFLEEHPTGLERRERSRGGCLVRRVRYLQGQPDLLQEHEVTCALPPLPPLAHYTSSNTTTSCLGLVKTSCDPGASLVSGDLERQCLQSGQWSGSAPTCHMRSCPALYPAPGSQLSSEATAIGSTVSVRCSNACEAPSSSPYLACQESGEWNASLPYCTRRVCHPLPLPKHTLLLHADHTPRCGSKTVFACAPGMSLVYGDLTRRCVSGGVWLGAVPLCAITHCPSLPTPPHSRLTGSATHIGATVTVECDRCHQAADMEGFSGAVTVQCLSSGVWSGALHCRRVSCPALSAPQGASMQQLNTTCLGTAQFSCLPGHRLEGGSLSRRCQSGGGWSGAAPRCAPLQCLWSSPGPLVEVVLRASSYGEKTLFRCSEGSRLRGGVLERWCLEGGRWSGELPDCGPEPPEAVLSVTMAPDQVYKKQAPVCWQIIAVCGWVLFAVAAIFIGTVLVLMKRGLLGSLERKSSFERQITQSTNVGTLDSRKSRSVEKETYA